MIYVESLNLIIPNISEFLFQNKSGVWRGWVAGVSPVPKWGGAGGHGAILLPYTRPGEGAAGHNKPSYYTG